MSCFKFQDFIACVVDEMAIFFDACKRSNSDIKLTYLTVVTTDVTASVNKP